MPDIVHRVQVRAPPQRVYAAVASPSGLASWWTTDVRGDGAMGMTLEFRFGGAPTAMLVEALEPARRVRWRCTGGPPEWVGSTVEFSLEPVGDHTVLRFVQAGHAAGDFYGHCNTKWAFFLLSLKESLETGRGRPHPIDSDL